jgi:hypothetical protein
MDIGTRIPSRELERRWHSLQQAMRQAGLDCLIVQNDNQFIGGYVRYLVDVPATQYPPTVILPADGELVVIHHGPPDEGPGAPPFDRGVGLRISRPYIPTLHYTNRYAAEAAVRYL